MKKIRTLLFCLLLSVLALTACGGAASYKTADSVAMTAAAMAPAAGGMNVGYNEKLAYMETETASETLDTKSESSLSSSASIIPNENIARKLIRMIHLDVETDHFDELLKILQDQIAALSGYIEQSDISGRSIQYDNSRRLAYMTVRIPSTKLDQFITSVEENGNVTNKSENTTDITLKYSDLESRKKSLTIEQDRIWALLEKADTLEAVIALEERLSEIRYELESMESRLRLYDNQIEYSTVQINVREVKIYTPTTPLTFNERIAKGFSENIDHVKDFITDFAVLVIASIPIWVPILFLLFAIGCFVRRKATGINVKKKLMNLPGPKDQSHDPDNMN